MAKQDKATHANSPAPAASVALVPAAPEIGAQALSPDASDPDRIVDHVTIGTVRAPVTQRDVGRAVSAGYRRELIAMIHAQRLAAAIADGLMTIGEVPDGRILDVTVELRRRGLLPLAGAGTDDSASE